MFDSFFNPKLPFVAIDLSDRSVKIARVKGRRGKKKLVGVHNAEIPEGVVFQGRVQDVAALGNVLSGILHSGPGRHIAAPAAVMALPEEHCFIRTIKVPRLAEHELHEAIRWEAEAAVPLPPTEAIISWEVLPGDPAADHIDAVVAATSRDLAESYVAALRRASLLPVGFEPESFAITRALLDPHDRDVVLIIDLGREHTGVIIVRAQSVQVTANIPIAARTFTERIASARKIAIGQAEELKRKQGIEPDSSGVSLRDALAPVLEDLVRQIKQFFSFYETHAHIDPVGKGASSKEEEIQPSPIRRVMLTGGDAVMPGLPPYLAEALGVPVEVGDPFRNVSAPRKKFMRHPLFTTSIGLALYEVDISTF